MNALELLAEQAVARTEGHVIPTTPQQGQQSDRHQYGQPIVPTQHYQSLRPSPTQLPPSSARSALSETYLYNFSTPFRSGAYLPNPPRDNMPSTFQSHHQLHQPEHWSDDWWNQQDHDDQSFNINTLHHPTVPVAQKENDQPVAELPKIDEERKKTTTGSKSGSTNRRDGGDSDVEIEMLSPEDMKAAVLKDPGDEKKSGVSEEDKLLLVEYLTRPERWKNFKLRQGALMINAASDIFKTKYTATQLSNAWKALWEKYKAVRERQEHTGGGDGDADRGEDDKIKERIARRGKAKFSERVLDAFEASKIFELLDKVAHDDSSVVRGQNMNSTSSISEPESSSDDEEKKRKKKKKRTKRNRLSDDDEEEITRDKFLADAVGAIQDKNKVAREMEYKNYELALKRDKREEKAKQEELKLAVAQRRNVEWERATKMMESPIAKIRQMGEALAERLCSEEGL
ncbi:hypothetical protein C8J55DRAFT_604065 [Lentinula edodes]|uniref:Uncharacterized protein n=1 Tax=Lentinula lateritia TaxID=40482 RepID=A0A9W9AR63_9AGAR|nr:hypothetical protein C8J55DRAFT_604065 [Lentinula edodes]